MRYLFNTVKPSFVDQVKLSYVGGWGEDPTRAICNELQFFNATPAFVHAQKQGTSITKYLLKTYIRPMFNTDDYHSLIINSYTHKLPSEGLYPNQPIWHCDYARLEHEEQVKTKVIVDEKAQHWYIILGDKPSVPVPQFIDKHNISLKEEIDTENSWFGVSKLIDRRVKSGWHPYKIKPFELFTFRGNELYRSTMTTEPVSRFAIRVTLYPEGHPYRKRGGLIRKLQTVYMTC